MPRILGDIPPFGRIYECCNCPNIHLQLGPVSIALSREAYMQLVELVTTSAANFQLARRDDRTAGKESADVGTKKYCM